MKIVIITFVLFISPLTLANNDFQGEQFLCSKLLWGFDFISSDKVKVISTDINNQTFVKEYYYETDTELPYINLYLDEKKIQLDEMNTKAFLNGVKITLEDFNDNYYRIYDHSLTFLGLGLIRESSLALTRLV